MNVFQETERRTAGSMVMNQPGRLPRGEGARHSFVEGKSSKTAWPSKECSGCKRLVTCALADRVNCVHFIAYEDRRDNSRRITFKAAPVGPDVAMVRMPERYR